MSTLLWVDASAGVAGDMLLAALVDAGADLEVVRRAVEAVVPGEVGLDVERVTRAGIAAAHLSVTPTVQHEHHRPWRELSALIREADLAEPVRDLAHRAFEVLARAEVHRDLDPGRVGVVRGVGVARRVGSTVGLGTGPRLVPRGGQGLGHRLQAALDEPGLTPARAPR